MIVKPRALHAILGGTFDPVHNGHLRMAIEVQERLGAQQVDLLPCYQPVHRDDPGATVAQRLTMLHRAVTDVYGLSVDSREIDRKGPSYSVHTLQEIRQEKGGDISLVWVMGSDAFAGFECWHQWQTILTLCHLVVVLRPGTSLKMTESLHAGFCESLSCLHEKPAGAIVPMTFAPLDISSTYIRKQIAEGKSPRFLLPDTVYDYIKENNLYSTVS